MIQNIKCKKLYENAVKPKRANRYAAGIDLSACMQFSKVTIDSGCYKKIGCGYAFEIPEGFVGLVFPRSGLSTKQGLRLTNCVGVIDSDYRGEVQVPLYNDSLESQTVRHGERIAQLVIMPYVMGKLIECDELNETSRGANGFGSTGK